MKARNMMFNVDGLGIAWYTSSNSDFERGNTVGHFYSHCVVVSRTAITDPFETSTDNTLSQLDRDNQVMERKRKASDPRCTRLSNRPSTT